MIFKPRPGLLKSHYSPSKLLYFYDNHQVQSPEHSGLILHCLNEKTPDCEKVIYTSYNNNLPEIAANLFSSLHGKEDDEQINQIHIEPVIESGFGIAIMDRIKKAAYKYESIE